VIAVRRQKSKTLEIPPVAIVPGGAAIARGLLYFYFSRWWKR
jgi:hypothetical protein